MKSTQPLRDEDPLKIQCKIMNESAPQGSEYSEKATVQINALKARAFSGMQIFGITPLPSIIHWEVFRITYPSLESWESWVTIASLVNVFSPFLRFNRYRAEEIDSLAQVDLKIILKKTMYSECVTQ